MITRILTGLSEHEWKEAWKKIHHAPAGTTFVDEQNRPMVEPTFEEWKEAVIDEGHNRRFISYAYTGKRCSLRAGVQEVINEILNPTTPTAEMIATCK